jgi:hypothetical protein
MKSPVGTLIFLELAGTGILAYWVMVRVDNERREIRNVRFKTGRINIYTFKKSELTRKPKSLR